jgi:hypothetical protein
MRNTVNKDHAKESKSEVLCTYFVTYQIFMVALGGLVVSVLDTGPKVRGFKPGRGRWI